MLKWFAMFFFMSLLLLSVSRRDDNILYTDVLVIGGGSGGTCAGIQSARAGVQTIIAEPTTWLGGMISAAGVSAFDGNHELPSGIWTEFREKLYKVYGGPDQVATGWVSNTLFEPHVADSILKGFAALLPELRIFYRHRFLKAITDGHKVKGAVFRDLSNGRIITIYAKQVIDATELGDVMASAGVPFDTGMEAASITGENVGVTTSNDIIQDLTYTAILKDYGQAVDCTIVKPAHYDPMEFECSCTTVCSDTSRLFSKVAALSMLNYGKLPRNKYMINWPAHGNDIYLNIISDPEEKRETALEKARAKTMRFIYFIQTSLGFRNLTLADDEFPTADRLPMIPYHREGRRLRGLVRFRLQDIVDPYQQNTDLYRTGIAVGDYPIDHHHRENPDAPQHLAFYPVPSFNVPQGVLIPERYDGMIVAEKGISVSNVVNGTTRLQPVVMGIGQAAGMLAALSVKQHKEPRAVDIRDLQASLLEAKCYIMPYNDVGPRHPSFLSIQKIGATGILKGRGEPYKWENRTWFYPDSPVVASAFPENISPFITLKPFGASYLTINDAIGVIQQAGIQYNIKNAFHFTDTAVLRSQLRDIWDTWQLKDFRADRAITRAELAVLLDKTIDPFNLRKIDHQGHFK